MTDTQKLRELIAAVHEATDAHGETAWYETDGVIHVDPAGIAKADAEYIAYLKPERVSALLDEIDRLRARLEINEASPEWDGIACRDETIRLQDAEIDRLSAALKAAKSQIEADREALLCCHGLDGVIPADDQLGRDGLAEYDEVLHTITAALASGNGDAT